jgi:hypothetical protein
MCGPRIKSDRPQDQLAQLRCHVAAAGAAASELVRRRFTRSGCLRKIVPGATIRGHLVTKQQDLHGCSIVSYVPAASHAMSRRKIRYNNRTDTSSDHARQSPSSDWAGQRCG